MTRIAQILTLTVLFPATLLAQDELLDEEVVPIKRYTVELVVFTYEENVGVGTEFFPPDQIEIPTEGIDEGKIEEIVVEERIRRHPDVVGLIPIILSEEELTMYDVVEQLELLDAYHPIMHVGWTQAGFPRQDTDAMELTVFGEPPLGLDGSFTLYLERYLHLVVDLAMDAPVEVIEIEFDDNSSYELEDYEFGDTGTRDGPVRYRMQEDRIVKNGEIRYFDHPKFGVVAKVVRVEEPEEEEEEEENNSALLLSRAAQ